MTSAHPSTPAPSTQDQPTLKIQYYRLLDFLQSKFNRTRKEISSKQQWGPEWRNYVRPGRTYTRVIFSPIGFDHGWKEFEDIAKNGEDLHAEYRIRPEPGWEWYCPNCHEYSLITEAMMPELQAKWANMAQQAVIEAKQTGVKLSIPPMPTASRANCPNCRYRPGAPE